MKNRRVFMLSAIVGSGSLLSINSVMAVVANTEKKEGPNPVNKTVISPSVLPMLKKDDPTANALGYVEKTETADGKKYPKHTNKQNCANCALYQGKTTDTSGGCPLFVGKHVAAKGWCSAYALKM